MNTSCENCVFLQNYNCSLNKLDLYAEKQIEIEFPGNGAPILKDFVCPFKRTRTQIENHLIKENGFPYSHFIYENGRVNILKAVEEILKLDHQPKYLQINLKYMNEDHDILHGSNKLLKDSGIKYKLNINMDKQLDHFYESFLSFRLNCNTPFISISFDNAKLKPSLTTNLSEKIQRELYSFPFATTKNNEFVIFPRGIIEEYLSIEGSKFIDKIFETQCIYHQL